MGAIWTEEAKFRAWLKVELAVCRARARLGEIPSEEVEDLAEKADVAIERHKEAGGARSVAWLKVGLAVCRARARLGEIPSEEVEDLAEKADFTIERIKEVEEETNHDVIAFVTAVSETVAAKGSAQVARHFHFGL